MDEARATADQLGSREEYTAVFNEEEALDENTYDSPAEQLNADYREDEEEDILGHGGDDVVADDPNNNRTQVDNIVDTVLHHLYQKLGLPGGSKADLATEIAKKVAKKLKKDEQKEVVECEADLEIWIHLQGSGY